MPLISIIIPYYKKKEFISRCLRSIYNQSYSNYEIILIYDDEDMKDYQHIVSFKKIYRKLIIIKNTKRRGAGQARNIGIEFAKGNYIAFLDSDDVWHKDKLKIQITLMKKNNWEISHTSYKIIDRNNIITKTRKAKDLNFSNLIKSCDVGLSSVIMKKSLFNNKIKFPDLKTKEDYVLWLKIARKRIIIQGIDKVLMKWQKSNNSLSSNTLRKLFDGYSVYRIYMNFSMIKSLYSLLVLSLNFLVKKNS
jgi:teichuronic acid biosynthesis glycosyltransferase TuaG